MLTPDVEYRPVDPADDKLARLRRKTGLEMNAARKQQERRRRDWLLVSCWNVGQHESWLMWKAYCADPSGGVCVQSTFRDLQESLKNAQPQVKTRKVEYGVPSNTRAGPVYLPRASSFVFSLICFQYAASAS